MSREVNYALCAEQAAMEAVTTQNTVISLPPPLLLSIYCKNKTFFIVLYLQIHFLLHLRSELLKEMFLIKKRNQNDEKTVAFLSRKKTTDGHAFTPSRNWMENLSWLNLQNTFSEMNAKFQDEKVSNHETTMRGVAIREMWTDWYT